jgi:transcriptional regulator with XRE-family HTH domain
MFQGDFKPAPEGESIFDRVERLYDLPGGPLIGWLEDDADKRGHDFKELADALGVTMGYILQLRSGIRRVPDITHDFCASCAKYLGIPPIAVKVLAGVIRLSDFLNPAQTEEEVIERAIRKMQDDPVIRQSVPRPRRHSFFCTQRHRCRMCWACRICRQSSIGAKGRLSFMMSGSAN